MQMKLKLYCRPIKASLIDEPMADADRVDNQWTPLVVSVMSFGGKGKRNDSRLP